MIIDKKEYWSKSQLKQRGWTEAKIKEWLKKPDKETENPFYPSASYMQLYLASRVKRQERSKKFKEWLEKSKARRKKISKSLKETNKRKKQELIEYINSLEIKIPKMPLKELRKRTIEQRNYSDDYIKKINNDKHSLNEIYFNYLMYKYSRYYKNKIDKMFKKTGKDEAYLLLKQKVNEEIFKVYPDLKSSLKKIKEEKRKKLEEILAFLNTL